MTTTILISSQVLVLPLVVKEAADRVVETGEVRHILGLAVMLLAVQVLHGAASYVQVVTVASAGEHVGRRLRQRLFDAYLQAPLSVFVSSSPGSLASRISHDVSLLQLGSTMHLPAAISGGLVTIVAAVALLLVSPELAIVGFLFIPVVVVVTVASSGSLGTANRVSLTQLGRTLAAVVEVLTVEGATAVRLFRREHAERARFEAIQDGLYDANVRQARVGAISAAVAQTVAGLAVAGVILIGVWLLSAGRVTIGELVAFLLLLQQAYAPAGELATAVGQLRGTHPAVIRYNEAIALAAVVPDRAAGQRGDHPQRLPSDDLVLEARG